MADDVFDYPVLDFSGDFIAGSGISNDDKKNLIPLGTISIWYKAQVPENWLECNGQAVNPSDYPDLYKMMRFTPNFQGMFLRGAGNQTVTHGSYGSVSHGTTLGQVQGDTIRNINGTFSTESLNYVYGGGAFQGLGIDKTQGDGGSWGAGSYNGNQVIKFDASLTVPISKENRPVNVGVKYIIKAK